MNFSLDEEWYTIPQVDGSMQLMSRQQILDHILMSATLRFDVPKDTRYMLHTKANPEGVRIFLDEDENLLAAGFNPDHPVRFTIHGWNGDTTSDVNAVAEFLEAGNFNHIVVDWSAGAGTINYIDARNRVPEVAKHVGLMAAFLVRMGSSWSNIYVIGHSLGGQMAGLVGQYLQQAALPTPAACVCLDPAGPLFSANDESDRASPDDCDYVEVIHTNGGMLGFTAPIGNGDFYPNGGKSQPGCGLDLTGSCAHARAPLFFKESLITNKPFEAQLCTGSVSDVTSGKCVSNGEVSLMLGVSVNYAANGLYYLTTADSSPFVLPLSLN